MVESAWVCVLYYQEWLSWPRRGRETKQCFLCTTYLFFPLPSSLSLFPCLFLYNANSLELADSRGGSVAEVWVVGRGEEKEKAEEQEYEVKKSEK